MTDNYGREYRGHGYQGQGYPQGPEYRDRGYETQAYETQAYAGRPAGNEGTGRRAAPGGGPEKSPNGAVIDHAQFAAGAVATALVAAVAGFVVTAIINAVYTSHALGSAWVDGEQDPWDSALIGGVGGLVAGAVLWMFLNLVPSPLTFFRWIAGLFVFAAVVLPFLSGTDWVARLITAVLNAFLGILVIALLTAVAEKTTDVGRR
ncbi:hypothetical protein [Tomitella gaofuii]|uniref:hypothetical protein n=1 Tax=Tomitella gaofuii TaxID=2760083 RepID=UPI0015FC9765|nr:hypothetical protein [Tomitella gaofuii]